MLDETRRRSKVRGRSGTLAQPKLEDNFAFQDHVELLLSAAPLVMLLNKRLVRMRRYEEVGSKGVDAERVLEQSRLLTPQSS